MLIFLNCYDDDGECIFVYVVYGVVNRFLVDVSVIVFYDLVSVRFNDGFDDLEGDDVLYNGVNMWGDLLLCRLDVVCINLL